MKQNLFKINHSWRLERHSGWNQKHPDMLQGPLPEAGGFCFRPSAQRAGLAGNIPGGLPPVIRLGGPFNQSLNVVSRHSGLFCFRPSAQRAGFGRKQKIPGTSCSGIGWGRWRIRTAVNGFADRYLATRLTDRNTKVMVFVTLECKNNKFCLIWR